MKSIEKSKMSEVIAVGMVRYGSSLLKGLGLGSLLLGGVSSLSGQVVDQGYIWVTGTTYSTSWTTWGTQERFIWNPDKLQLTAGTDGLSSNSAGIYTFALGDHARPWGQVSVALGENVTTYANYSFAQGLDVVVGSNGIANVAMGYDLIVNRNGAVALGYSGRADGVGAIAIGENNDVEGWGSLALGVSNLVDLSGPTVRGAYAIGHGLTVKDQDAFVVGKFNDNGSDVSDNYAFVVGIGTDGANRADAFTVDASGNVWAAGSFTSGVGTMSVGGDLLFSNNALVSSNGGSTNIDHIWHDDGTAGGAGGTWNFVSDGSYKGTGNARLRAGHIWMTASQNNYIAGNVGIGTSSPSAKLDVNGDTVVRGDLQVESLSTSSINLIEPILVRGSSNENPVEALLKIGDTTIYDSFSGRGLRLTILSKSDHSIAVSPVVYDTYNSSTACNNLASALNGITRDQIGILTSHDAWEGQARLSSPLKDAFRRLGLYRISSISSDFPDHRMPYAAIFEGVTGNGGSAKAVECLMSWAGEGNGSEQSNAELRGFLIDGSIAVTGNSANNVLTNLDGSEVAVEVDHEGYVTQMKLRPQGDIPMGIFQ